MARSPPARRPPSGSTCWRASRSEGRAPESAPARTLGRATAGDYAAHCSSRPLRRSHAGSGTFLGALALGVPQLCLPQAADQFRNAEGGGRSGAALVLLPPEASMEAIADAASRLLSEDRFRVDAAVVADEIAAMPSPAEVVEVLARKPG
ncbi:MAG: nucleotide disphospho-sugar-binding domain-containing protein [Nocardioides sp.]